jgi:hypothetical protein
MSEANEPHELETSWACPACDSVNAPDVVPLCATCGHDLHAPIPDAWHCALCGGTPAVPTEWVGDEEVWVCRLCVREET